MSKKAKKWDKGDFMKAWGAESKKGHKTWEAFAAGMAKAAEAQGVDVPNELSCWNRIHTLKAALLKADPDRKCPPVPERPRKEKADKPKTADEIADELGW